MRAGKKCFGWGIAPEAEKRQEGGNRRHFTANPPPFTIFRKAGIMFKSE
ncbi:hypothetical protein BCO26_1713 [Heyndrickxia coagulans 2-6]|nr:hypothetical protein BCO26_1713 [Heyndrickxia coagulans 2-6]